MLATLLKAILVLFGLMWYALLHHEVAVTVIGCLRLHADQLHFTHGQSDRLSADKEDAQSFSEADSEALG